VLRSRIEPMKKIAQSLRRHRKLILNYFRAQKLLSSGVVEGLNNKSKVTMRKSYGFRTFRCLELALDRLLGKLPEPESTHEFFGRTKIHIRFGRALPQASSRGHGCTPVSSTFRDRLDPLG
jgi:hypothetical protein